MRHVVTRLAASMILALAACAETQASHGLGSRSNTNIPCSESCHGDAACMATCAPSGANAHDAPDMELPNGDK